MAVVAELHAVSELDARARFTDLARLAGAGLDGVTVTYEAAPNQAVA